MKHLFIGSAIATVMPDGKVRLPKRFFDTLTTLINSGDVFIGIGSEGDCLKIYDQRVIEDPNKLIESDSIEAEDEISESHERWLRQTFTFVDKVELNEGGSITIGRIMRTRGQIGSAVLLRGAGQQLEIWDLTRVFSHGRYDLRWLAERHLDMIHVTDQTSEPAVTLLTSAPAAPIVVHKLPAPAQRSTEKATTTQRRCAA